MGAFINIIAKLSKEQIFRKLVLLAYLGAEEAYFQKHLPMDVY